VSAEGDSVIEVLAQADMGPGAQVVARTIATADPVAARLDAAWPQALDQLEALAATNDEAAALRRQTIEAVQHHELADPLVDRLAVLERQTVDLLGRLARDRKPPPPRPPGYTRIDAGKEEQLRPGDAEAKLGELRALVGQDDAYRLTLEWIVEREDDTA
jgi:hypothetical protein